MIVIDYLFYYGFPIILMLGLVWYMRRQGTLMAAYRQGQELQHSGHELVRESLRLQSESNELMRELIEALRHQR